MKTVLDILLPQILPEGVNFKTIPHSGKSDLEASIPRKLKAWQEPDTKFVIVRDQDSADCIAVKKHLLELCAPFRREVLVRIACRELESWYFGDLKAISDAYKRDITGLADKAKYRHPDSIGNPKQELKKLFPKHQQIDGARRIASYMDINRNDSTSFCHFVSGVRKLCETTDT